MSRRPDSDDPPSGLPIFKRRFSYQGTEYVERFVGTDPREARGTTTIPTIVVPVRLDFGNGIVRDTARDTIVGGRTELDWVLQSPIFQPAPIVSGSTLVGDTQWGDAFMRANFWSELADKNAYHTTLQQPTVRPETWVVPAPWAYFNNPYSSFPLPSILYDQAWLGAQVEASAARINNPAALIVFILPPETYWGDVAANYIYGDGYHDSLALPGRPNGPLQTYIVTNSRGANHGSFQTSAAVTVLSHEIQEWYNDPFVDNYTNYTPPWVLYSPADCSNWLETGDFLSDNGLGPHGGYSTLYSAGQPYAMLEGVFFDWFTRRPQSRSVNGWYSLFNTAIGFSEPCATDGDRYAQTTIDFPGATRTFLSGINRFGDIVGRYRDATGTYHGLLYANGAFQTLDPPGAYYTNLVGINDQRQISGYFIDGSGYHGVTYAAGAFTTYDYGAGFDTLLFKINNAGVVAGAAYPQDGVSPGHSFILANGHFRNLRVPFGSESVAVDISDVGVVAGQFDSGDPNAVFGYLDIFGHFESVRLSWSTSTYPESVRGPGSLTGWAIDQLGYWSGLTKPRADGDWQHIFVDGSFLTILNGSNDLGSLVGAYGDRSGFHGVLLTPKDSR